jgi:hypothetical protein
VKVGIYAVYDRVAESVQGGLHCFPHDAIACRFFRDVVEAPDTQVNKHPADYDLVSLGVLDAQVPCLELESVRVVLAGASVLAMGEGK